MTVLAQGESEDPHQAAYDEAQYLSEWSANQIKELGTHFEDFSTSICTAACDRSPFEPGAHQSADPLTLCSPLLCQAMWGLLCKSSTT